MSGQAMSGGSYPPVIRPAREADAPQMASIYAPFVRGSHTSFEFVSPDGVETARRLESAMKTHPWVIASRGGDRILGFACAAPHRSRSPMVDVLWLERVLGPPMAPATPSEPLPPEPFRVTGRQPRFAASYIDA